jgi:hypothetical protein
MTWKEATLQALTRMSLRHRRNFFKRTEIIKEELENITRDEAEDRHDRGTPFLQPKAEHCRACIRQHSLMQEDGSVHPAGAYQGKHPMEDLLSGSQY